MVVYIDLETTGFSREWDNIIEIAAILYNPKTKSILNQFHEYIKPDKNIPSKITELTGITNSQVRFCRSEREVVGEFIEWLYINTPKTVVGHNYKSFDKGFINAKTAKYGIKNYEFSEEIDTLQIARKALPKGMIENHKQTTLAAYYDIDYEAHSAIEDVKALIKIHEKLTPVKATRDLLGF